MGMFDTVHFECPKCQCDIEVQTKAGKCVLADYSQSSVPPGLAADIQGERVWCQNEKCREGWRVTSEVIQRGVPMMLTQSDIEETEEEV